MTLVFLSWTSQKISALKNLARVAVDEQNGPDFREFAGESGSDLMNKCVMWSSPHQYILYKQPTFWLPATPKQTMTEHHDLGILFKNLLRQERSCF